MTSDDIVPLALLGVGVFMLSKASKRGPRQHKERKGDECNPNDSAPYGYECGQVAGGWELREERERYLGFGHYNNRAGIDAALASLGYPGGNLQGFQIYMSSVSDWDLRRDGLLDPDTITALEEAEGMLGRGEWVPPRGEWPQ